MTFGDNALSHSREGSRLDRPLRILLVSYRFPPQGGSGVHRLTALVRDWSRLGCRVAVLSGPPSGHRISDPSLLQRLPADLTRCTAVDPSPAVAVRRRRERLAGSFPFWHFGLGRVQALLTLMSVPDVHCLWPASAVASGIRLARRFEPDVVVASGPPWTSLLAASMLSRFTGKPLVLDYRDPWTATYLRKRGGRLRRFLSRRLEASILSRATGLTAAHASVLRYLLAQFRSRLGQNVPRAWIPNGYSRDDFASVHAPHAHRKFVLSYSGSFYADRSPGALLQALRDLGEEGKIRPGRFVLRLVGSVDHVRKLARDDQFLAKIIRYEDQVPHRQSLSVLQQGTVNLVFVRDTGGLNLHTPAKFYEVAYAGRPLLLLSPEGVTTRLARHLGGCWIAHPEDPAAIRSELADLIRRRRDGIPLRRPARDRLAFYERSRQSERFLRFLRSLCDNHSALPSTIGRDGSEAPW